MIAGWLVDLVDDAGYIPADLGQAAEAGRRRRRDRGGAGECRPSSRRACAPAASPVPRHPAEGKDRYDPAMRAVIANLEMLARRDLVGLMRVSGCDAEDLAGMIAEIRALNPKPGLALRRARFARHRARRLRARDAAGQLGSGAERRHAAARAGQQPLCGAPDHRSQRAKPRPM